jgi:2'-5' RNA ligase
VRLFIGLEVGDGVRRRSEETIAELRRRLGRRIDARWTRPENLHLTVRFIGHVAEDRVAPLLSALEVPLTTPPFEIAYRGCGRFPLRGAPRVVWTGLARGQHALRELHDEFNVRLRPFGYPPENRPFSAHLTLARIRDARAADGRLLDEALVHVAETVVMQKVETVTVFESRLSANGPQYSAVRRLSLPTS